MQAFTPHRRSWLLPTFMLITLLLTAPALTTHAAPQPNSWTFTGRLNTGRLNHTATLLPDGNVLVAGGDDFASYFPGNNSIASAEIYDSRTGIWTVTGNLHVARDSHTATLLTTGQVLVAGGTNSGSGGIHLASAELYDPNTGVWSYTGSLNSTHAGHTATLLPNGKVLVAGGIGPLGDSSASAELYDPTTGRWTATDSLNTARYGHTATLLPNDKVLVTGGLAFGIPTTIAELYDPKTGTWTATNSPTASLFASTTLLFNGTVLIAGGQDAQSNFLAGAQLYDPASGTWSVTGSMSMPHAGYTATLLSNGKVLVSAGDSNGIVTAKAELYDPATGIWTAASSLNTALWHNSATLLLNGQVLVAGGVGTIDLGSGLTNTELYDPGTALTVGPRSGVVGQIIQLTGADFGPTEAVKIYANTLTTPPVITAMTDAAGAFTIHVPVHPGPVGLYTLLAVGQNSGDMTKTFFTIKPELVLNPSAGAIGTMAHAYGFGFGAQEAVQLYWDDATHLLGSAISDVSGSFAGSRTFAFTVPSDATSGRHTITAIGQVTHVVTTAHFILP